MELTSRFTLFDLLSMVFPGCFIIWSIMSFDIVYQYVHKPAYMNDIFLYIAFFVAAYMIGISWNMLMRGIWRAFENSFRESCLNRIIEKRSVRFLNDFNTLEGDTNTLKYKNAYSEVCKNDPKRSIAVLESQVAMLRNIAFPFAFWIATVFYDKTTDNICCCVLLCFLAFISIYSLAIFRQRRKYDIVLTKHSYMKKSVSKE